MNVKQFIDVLTNEVKEEDRENANIEFFSKNKNEEEQEYEIEKMSGY